MSAASKEKQKAVVPEEGENDYRELQTEEEEDEEDGEMAAQCFQHMQCNKKLIQKKANKAKEAVVIAYKVQSDFLGHIPNGLGVKILFVGAEANCAAAYKYNTG
ncbi:hypothetical protein H2248_012516 [Termitomyces sp. 'cryptogamus']|nr:hypothetical protein H2248_012516 [Termitomyces sp. 'cryptogamus']